MKIKNILLSFVVLFATMFTLSSCFEDKYNVFVEDYFNLLIEPLENEYKAGEKVEIKLGFRSGPSVGVVVDDKALSREKIGTDENGYYELFSFVMPKKDVTIRTMQDGYFNETECFSKIISFKYARSEGNKLVLPNEDVGGNYEFTFPYGTKIGTQKYNEIFHEINMYIPENNGGYYVFDGFYDSLLKTKNKIFEPGFVIDNDYTFYYTYEGGNATPPTGTFKLTITKGLDFIYDAPVNGKMDVVPGTIVKFHTHPFMDVDLAMYINGEFIMIQDCIRVNDEYIWEYSFEMPAEDVIIEFKTQSEEYAHVDDIYDWASSLLEKDAVYKVKKETGLINSKIINVSYSENELDINKALKILCAPLIPLKDVMIDIADTTEFNQYTFYTENNLYSIKIIGNLIYANGSWYRYVNDLVEFDEKNRFDCYSFAYEGAFKVYTYEENALVYSSSNTDPFNLSAFEFIKYNDDMVIEANPTHYIESEIATIYIQTNNIFYINENGENIFYILVGSLDFMLFTASK